MSPDNIFRQSHEIARISTRCQGNTMRLKAHCLEEGPMASLCRIGFSRFAFV